MQECKIAKGNATETHKPHTFRQKWEVKTDRDRKGETKGRGQAGNEAEKAFRNNEKWMIPDFWLIAPQSSFGQRIRLQSKMLKQSEPWSGSPSRRWHTVKVKNRSLICQASTPCCWSAALQAWSHLLWWQTSWLHSKFACFTFSTYRRCTSKVHTVVCSMHTTSSSHCALIFDPLACTPIAVHSAGLFIHPSI